MLCYRFLSSFLPPTAAKALTVVWLALLVTTVVFCAFEPQLSFKYGNM